MKEKSFKETALRVSNVSIVGNTALTLFKLFAGIIANSGAMVSDAIHSASDVLSSIIVIIGVKLASKESDKEHPYGHDRFECVAAIVLAVILFITGLFIGYHAIEKLNGNSMNSSMIPDVFALIAAMVSIIVKEAMYWYTRVNALTINSTALMAEAWHHRSDALSSIGALIGIYGARHGQIWMEQIASLVICVFIVKASIDIFKDAIKKMVDHSTTEEMENNLRECALSVEGVTGVSQIISREFGNKIYVNMDILASGCILLYEANGIQEKVHEAIEAKYPEVKHIFVRVIPE